MRGYLLLRSRALVSALRAAYPGQEVRWRDVWGAYMVGYAINNVFPLGSGNLAQLFLTRVSIPDQQLSDGGFAALWTGVVFDWFMGVLIMCFAFTQGVFPKPPDFSKLPAFDISFFASNMRFTLFFLTALAVLFLVAFALLSARVRAFWARVRQGLTILRDRDRYRREMAAWQLASWVFRFASYWALLDAFHIGGSVRNALLVLAVQVVASVFPFTPGGAGVQQALLLTIFAHATDVAAFSVGQQIATAALTTALGFGALVLIFRFRSFREVLQRGREHRRAETRGRRIAPGARHASMSYSPMPTFCRHNRLVQNCPICSREQQVELARWSARAPRGAPRPRPEAAAAARAGRPAPGTRASPARRTGTAPGPGQRRRLSLAARARAEIQRTRLSAWPRTSPSAPRGWRSSRRPAGPLRGDRRPERRSRGAHLAGLSGRLHRAARRLRIRSPISLRSGRPGSAASCRIPTRSSPGPRGAHDPAAAPAPSRLSRLGGAVGLPGGRVRRRARRGRRSGVLPAPSSGLRYPAFTATRALSCSSRSGRSASMSSRRPHSPSAATTA